MIKYLEDLLAGKIKKLAIITPPRIGKTTLGNVLAPSFALGRTPTETIITVSYGSELSETWGRRVRNILGDPAFHELQDSKGRSCINPSIITLLKPRTARRAIVID